LCYQSAEEKILEDNPHFSLRTKQNKLNLQSALSESRVGMLAERVFFALFRKREFRHPAIRTKDGKKFCSLCGTTK
jgi:hypothetical protein